VILLERGTYFCWVVSACSSTRKHPDVQLSKKIRSLMSWSSVFSSFNLEAKWAIFDSDIKAQSWEDLSFWKVDVLETNLIFSSRLCRARTKSLNFTVLLRARHKRKLWYKVIFKNINFRKVSKSPQLWILISGSNIARLASELKLLNALDQLIKLLNFFWICKWECLRVLELPWVLIMDQRCPSIRREVSHYSKGGV
jgi:hypothetical protein